MKIASLFLSFMFVAATYSFAQTLETNTVSGIITEVKPHFAGQHTIMLGETELVLITNNKDKSGKTFEINKEYKDILLDEKGIFVLNPKYANKPLKFTYTLNGKGWKCISNISKIKK